MENANRRYTDQEVALVLQRAAEIEEQAPGDTAAPRGLTLHELHDIAREVGLSPAVIDEALMGLTTRRRSRSSFLGAPLSRKMVRGVPHHLGDEAFRHLIHVTEDCLDATGTVTEALGTVRWTSVSSGHKFDRTTQISLSSTNDETQIQVVQRYPAGFRAFLHLLPGAWGAMIGGAVAASVAIPAIGAIGLGVAVGGAALGVGIGRGIWHMMSRRSERQVEKVVTELVTAAGEITDK